MDTDTQPAASAPAKQKPAKPPRARRERRLFWVAVGLGLTTLVSLVAVAAVPV
jgi:hypothetical protein